MDQRKVLERNKIVEMYAGSRAYGTSLPTSDIDIRGIFVGDPVSIRTPFFHVDEVELPENDIKFFELNKFIKLVVDQNPNVVELLWTSGPDIIMSSPAYELLRQARGNLLTSKVAFATSGYAFSQLSRMKNSKKNVNSLEPLNDLCSLLKRAVEDGNIDKNFIEEHCGNNVLNYMLENKYLV